MVTKAISHVLYRVADREKEHVKHHDKLRICEDRDIPLWIRRKRHKILTAEEQSVDGPISDLQLDGIETLFHRSQPDPPTDGTNEHLTRFNKIAIQGTPQMAVD